METLQLPVSDSPGSTSAIASSVVNRRRSLPLAMLLVQLTDAALLLIVILAVCYSHLFDKAFSAGELVVAGAAAAAAAYVWLYQAGTYQISCLSKMPPRLWMTLLGASLAGALLFGISLKMLPSQGPHVSVLRAGGGVWAVATLVSFSMSRFCWSRLFAGWMAAGVLQRRVIVVSNDKNAVASVERIADDPDSNFRVAGFHADVCSDLPPGCRAVDAADLEALVRRCEYENIDAVILAAPLSQTNRIKSIREALGNATVDVYIVPDLEVLRSSNCGPPAFGQTPFIRIGRQPLEDWQRIRKALFDYMMGGILLVVLAPLLLMIGAIIRLDSSGPALFRQPRIGFSNKVFLVYKFRTMYHHEDKASLSGSRQARRGDPRITRVGRWLRKYSLDELPQLFNVLRGEMSLVGPRPHPLNTAVDGRLFQDIVKGYAARHRVIPGITGLAQVNGCRGETVKVEQIEQRVAFDLFYIDNWSLTLDIRILIRTITKELFSSDAF